MEESVLEVLLDASVERRIAVRVAAYVVYFVRTQELPRSSVRDQKVGVEAEQTDLVTQWSTTISVAEIVITADMKNAPYSLE